VREGLERPAPALRVAARLAPEGVDARAVAEAAAAFEAIRRIEELTQRVLADLALDADVVARSPHAAHDLDDLHDALETAWQTWRERLA